LPICHCFVSVQSVKKKSTNFTGVGLSFKAETLKQSFFVISCKLFIRVELSRMVARTIQKLPRQHKFFLGAASTLLVVLLSLPSEKATASRDIQDLEIGKRYQLSMNIETSQQQHPIIDDNLSWFSHKVKKGDTLARVFKRAGLTSKDVYQVTNSGKEASGLKKIMPGDTIEIALNEDKSFHQLRYHLDEANTLIISNTANGFVASKETKDIETRLSYAYGEIKLSFWHAALRAGLSEKQTMELANIFGWDIDFALEIRPGDTFNVIYEHQFIEGHYIGEGNIVAAEFTNQGETFTAIMSDDGRYFTPEGRAMRKSFLRSPVDFTRISSNFTKRRYHPVQKRWKAHRGIDYAAKRGTPVKASGDGKVIKSTYDKYNGHHVFIQHGEKYTTKYLHFTKRMVRKGQKVRQGQIIGTVGSTGLASGPHLHYEFLVDGVHRNPRTVQLPKAEPIDPQQKKSFLAVVDKMTQHLQHNRRVMLAMR
jgi:murein DD-endopeptidase MepM/ murein hydrolase activator NlpD